MNRNVEYAKKNLEEIMEPEELEGWIETFELLQDSNLLSDIESTRKEYQKGETLTMDEVFGDGDMVTSKKEVTQ